MEVIESPWWESAAWAEPYVTFLLGGACVHAFASTACLFLHALKQGSAALVVRTYFLSFGAALRRVARRHQLPLLLLLGAVKIRRYVKSKNNR